VARSLVAELDGALPGQVLLDRTCPTCGAQHGPVTTPGRAWHCSVSHSGPFAVVAVVPASESAMIGVDVETRCPPDWPTLLSEVVAPGEPAPEGPQEFLALWVRKEAVLKATREGLSRPMSSIRLASPPDPPRILAGAPPLRLVDLDARPLQASPPVEIAAALAVEGEGLAITWERARI
jgi:4'-phosphopantetheinyl transferase